MIRTNAKTYNRRHDLQTSALKPTKTSLKDNITITTLSDVLEWRVPFQRLFVANGTTPSHYVDTKQNKTNDKLKMTIYCNFTLEPIDI